YEECILDNPPDYPLDCLHLDPTYYAPPKYSFHEPHRSCQLLEDPFRKVSIDFTGLYNVREHAKKKNNRKTAANAWPDKSDDTAKNGEGDQNDEGGGGAGKDTNNGDK